MRYPPGVEGILSVIVIRWRHDFTQSYPVASDLPGTGCKSDDVSYELKTALLYPYGDMTS
jgi:hypothetical protein